MYTFLYAEIDGICIILLAYILKREHCEISRSVTRQAFTAVIVASLVVLISDFLWVFTNGVPGLVGLNNVLSVIYLIAAAAGGYLWLLFVQVRVTGNSPFTPRVRLLLALPFLVYAFMCVATPWTHWFFSVDGAGIYHRGPLFTVEMIAIFGYLVAGGIHATYHLVRTRSRRVRKDLSCMALFALLPMAGCVIAYFFYGIPIVWPLASLSILVVYMSLQGQEISTDGLTGLNNRRAFDRALETYMAKDHEGYNVYLIMLDVDDFKKINDRYGHVEGDHALQLIGHALRNVGEGRNVMLARYGGDEFAVIMPDSNDSAVREVALEIRDAVANLSKRKNLPYSMTVSGGYGKFTPGSGMTANDLIANADNNLYEQKR